MSKKQTKQDKAFIAKIQSLTFGTGAKPAQKSGGGTLHIELPTPPCDECGQPMKLKGVVAFPILRERPELN